PIQRRVSSDIVSISGVAEGVLQVVQVVSEPAIPARLVHRSLPEQRRPDALRRARMQGMVNPVLHTLLVGVAVSRLGVGALVRQLIFVSDVVGLPFREASGLARKI